MPAKSVIAWFKDRAPETPEGATRLVGALSASGAADRAAKVARAAWLELDFDSDDEADFLSAAGEYLRPADHLARLDLLLWDGKEDEAKRMLPRVDDGYRLVAAARMKLAERTRDAEAALAAVPAKLKLDPGLVYETARYWRQLA
jgi:soluble lytic murein transglycosylase